MKRILPSHFTESGNTGRLTALILCLVISAGLSGQKPLTVLTETWTSPNWVNTTKTTNSYDGNTYLINSLNQNWDAGSVSWINFSQSVFTNNPDGTPSQTITQSWNGTWNNLQRITSTYNGSGKPLITVIEINISGTWLNTLKQTNTYNGSGFLINSLSQSWNIISSSWQNSQQSNYTLNVNGTPSQVITQTWDIGSLLWIDSQRSTYSYTTGNRVQTIVDEIMVSGNWQNDSRNTFTYDGGGHLINDLSQTWDIPSTSWKNLSQSNFTNNPDGSISQIIIQNWTTLWTDDQRITYTYSGATGFRILESDENSVLYPNPAHDAITIKMNQSISAGLKYFVIDETGKEVMTGITTEETTTLDINRLEKGIYFLRLSTTPNLNFKFIKE